MSETKPLHTQEKRPRRKLTLTEEERADLLQTRDHHLRPCQREKAAALLKIAAGQSVHQIALHALLKPRDPDTLYSWLDYYQQHRQLPVRPATGRGAFSPRGEAECPADYSTDAPSPRSPP